LHFGVTGPDLPAFLLYLRSAFFSSLLFFFALSSAGVNPKYVYGKVFELWEEFKDTLAMQSVVGGYYSDAADVIKRKDHIVNAMKE